MFFRHGVRLLGGQACEGEHSNLCGDVGPVSWHVLALESTSESVSHVVHSFADGDELVEPLLTVLWDGQDGSCDSSSVLWRGRVVSTDKNFNLGKNSFGRLLVGADEVKGASTLTIKSHDFSERLSNDHFEALVDEEAKSVCILVERS